VRRARVTHAIGTEASELIRTNPNCRLIGFADKTRRTSNPPSPAVPLSPNERVKLGQGNNDGRGARERSCAEDVRVKLIRGALVARASEGGGRKRKIAAG